MYDVCEKVVCGIYMFEERLASWVCWGSDGLMRDEGFQGFKLVGVSSFI